MMTRARLLMLFVLAVIFILPEAASARKDVHTYLVRGIVRDSLSDEPIPYAAVSAVGRKFGTVADSKGIFELNVPDSTITFRVSSQGYKPYFLKVSKNRVNLYAVYLAPQAEMLGEVVIRKSRYSKKNNPAVDMMERIRHTAAVNDPHRNPYYSYNKYQRVTVALNDIGSPDDPNALLKRFPFLWEHVDTSDVSGKPILNMSLKETTSDVYYRRDGNVVREIVTGQTSTGVDEITDQQSMQQFMDDVLREIDLYDRDINLLQNRFVSPLSPLAADFYKFFLTDSTTTAAGQKQYTLSFYPHNKAAFGFIGQMIVEPSDSAMFISAVNMRIAPEINLNFIENLALHQEYARAPDGSRLKTRDDLTLEVKVLPGVQGLYARRNVGYAGHSFEAPDDEKDIFGSMAKKRMTADAENRGEDYWQQARLIDMSPGESKVRLMMERLRTYPAYRYFEKGVKILFSGYVATGNPSKFDIGPVNTFMSYNDLEGLRLRAGGMTMASLSRNWFAKFYAAYGIRDHKWKYSVETEYSFNDKKFHPREFPVHSLAIKSTYDLFRPGENYMFTNPDNFVLSLKRGDNRLLGYELRNQLAYTLELENNFSVKASAVNSTIYDSRLLKFSLGDGTPLEHFDSNWLDLELRYAPGERFYQTRSYRIPINLDAPVFVLSHRYGPKAFGERWAVNRTEMSFQKRFWLSAWGYIDFMAKGGHVWSRHTPYTQLFTPNANMSYVIQPESFALINPMEFVADSYCSLDFTYWANGAILNYIPLVKKLKLREVFSARSFWGKLSDRNNPRLNPDMLAFPANPWGNGSDGIATVDVGRTPYIELSAGLDNIFRCLRLDYVWRITHRHPAYTISRSGLRLALHVTF